MNYLDTYDINAGASTPPADRPQQSLNEEVNQVIGQLGRFWGGFRKQSQTVLETARKDLGDVVVQAQKELSKLTTVATTTSSSQQATSTEEHDPRLRDTGTDDQTQEENADLDTTPISSSTATLTEGAATGSTKSTNDGTTTPSQPESHHQSTSSTSWSANALFSRLQSALPPNVVSTVQEHIPSSLRHASENIDFVQIRTNLFSEIQRIQGVTRAQAEEYVHKSEALLREAVKEAGEVLRDAVKVIPPEEADNNNALRSSGLVWDGSDMWMLPSEEEDTVAAAAGAADSSTAATGKKDLKGKSIESGLAAVATRAEALLRRLKHDPAIVRIDPRTDEAAREKYVTWVETEITSREGGLENEEWRKKIVGSLDHTQDGQALADLRSTLVPAEMTDVEFWQRFFFRAHQIKEEEEKRKALLEATTTESEEDFDWSDEDDDDDNDDDDESSDDQENNAKEAENGGNDVTARPSKTPENEGKDTLSVPGKSATTTRENSLDSYDVVSPANASISGESPPKPQGGKTEESDGDDDSDWE